MTVAPELVPVTPAHHVHFRETEGLLVAELTVGQGYPAGRGLVTIRGALATLNDIVVFPRAIRPVGLSRLRFWEEAARSLRGQGLGTSFLKAVCQHLADRGVREVQGEMRTDDIERLSRWYRRAGFEVDESTRAVRLHLGTTAGT